MRLTKMGHACVRVQKELAEDQGERDRAVLVIDPGTLTEDAALDGASAVLVTHEHFDHLDGERLRAALGRNPQLEIWANQGVVKQLGTLDGHVHTVGKGDVFSVAGFHVKVYGERHAVIHPDFPVVENSGFLIDGEVFHPGDAFTVPDTSVSTLLLPTNAPWLKVSEMIDYLRQVKPPHAYSIHDGLLNEHGLGVVDYVLDRRAREMQADVRRLLPGESVNLDA